MHDGGPVPALAVLAYPTLHAVQGEPDAALRAALDADPQADRFGPDAVLGMYENYLGGAAEGAEIFAVPGTASAADLAGFPPTIMINGEVDELRVSGEAFAASLSAAGTEVDVSTEPGTSHGHLNNPDQAAATHPSTASPLESSPSPPARALDHPQKDPPHDEPHRRRAHRPVESPRRRPEEHELRGRQHVREGHRDRPRHRASPSSCCG